MFENIANFFRKLMKSEKKEPGSKDAAKERLHLVLMQDRANVSADFLELMKQEIIEVIKKYIEVDEKEIDVRLTNKENEDGTNGAPALYANIPILNIKNEMKKEVMSEKKEETQENTVGNETDVVSQNVKENQDNIEVNVVHSEEIQENDSVGENIARLEETQESTVENETDVVPQNVEENQENITVGECNAHPGETQANVEEVIINQMNNI